MGLFSSKIVAGVLVGGLTLAGAGYAFGGTETLQNATTFVQEAGAKIVNFKSNEDALVSKISDLREDANVRIDEANEAIEGLNATVAGLEERQVQLEGEVADLKVEVDGLKAELASVNEELGKTQNMLLKTSELLSRKTAEYDAKVAELADVQSQLKGAMISVRVLENAIIIINDEWVKTKGQLKDAEAQVNKANEEVEEHGQAVDAVKGETEDINPMTQDEIDAIDTSLTDVAS